MEKFRAVCGVEQDCLDVKNINGSRDHPRSGGRACLLAMGSGSRFRRWRAAEDHEVAFAIRSERSGNIRTVDREDSADGRWHAARPDREPARLRSVHLLAFDLEAACRRRSAGSGDDRQVVHDPDGTCGGDFREIAAEISLRVRRVFNGDSRDVVHRNGSGQGTGGRAESGFQTEMEAPFWRTRRSGPCRKRSARAARCSRDDDLPEDDGASARKEDRIDIARAGNQPLQLHLHDVRIGAAHGVEREVGNAGRVGRKRVGASKLDLFTVAFDCGMRRRDARTGKERRLVYGTLAVFIFRAGQKRRRVASLRAGLEGVRGCAKHAGGAKARCRELDVILLFKPSKLRCFHGMRMDVLGVMDSGVEEI